MRRGEWFVGLVLIVVGVFAMIGQLFHVDVWKLVLPSLVILFGLWILLGTFLGRRAGPDEQVAIPLEGASRAELRLRHGAGRLNISGGAGAGELVAGTFGGGVDHSTRREGETLAVEMRTPPDIFLYFPFWGRREGLEWTLKLNEGLPLSLRLDTGASDAHLDLTDLQVTDLRISTGASSTDLRLPTKAGHTRVKIEAGVASVKVQVPTGVAARITARGGLTDVRVDKNRFPAVGGAYQSPDYEAAANRVEIHIQAGVGSISVR